MGCCKSKKKGGSKDPPTVAIIGVTGYIGKFMMPVFLDALENKQFKELRILISQDKVDNEMVQSYVTSGAVLCPVPKYDDAAAMAEALQGVDVLVSTLGVKGEEMVRVQDALIEAMVTAEVKVYFPSEYGTNHYKIAYTHPVFEGKKNHTNAAKAKGLRVIKILAADIMEASFGKWFGLDCKMGLWTVVGNGADVPCAMTAEKDIARFTVEAAILAHSDPNCPEDIEVYSDLRTLREYAKVFDNVTGWEITIQSAPKDEFIAEYNRTREFTKLLMLLIAEGAYDYSNSAGNELLNPNESVWKLKKIEEYAAETQGVPWGDFDERLLAFFPMGSLTLVSMVLNSSAGISSVASALNLLAQTTKPTRPPPPPKNLLIEAHRNDQISKREGMSLASSKRDGVSLASAQREAVSLASAKRDGLSLASSKRDGVSLASAQRDAPSLASAKRDGVSLASAPRDGVSLASKPEVVSLASAKRDGVSLASSKRDAVSKVGGTTNAEGPDPAETPDPDA